MIKRATFCNRAKPHSSGQGTKPRIVNHSRVGDVELLFFVVQECAETTRTLRQQLPPSHGT